MVATFNTVVGVAGYSKSGQMTGPFRHFDMKGSVLTGNSIKVKRDAEGSPLPQLLGVSSFDGSKLTTLERNNILVQVLTLTQLSTYCSDDQLYPLHSW